MKKIIVVVALLLITIGTLFGVSFYQEYHAEALIKESKVLSASGKYQEALDTLIKAKRADPSDVLLSEIDSEIRKNENLRKSQEYFTKGKSYFDDAEYELAIGFFKLISSDDINYSTAKTYIELAEGKLKRSSEGRVASTTTIAQPSASPPNKVENLEALCEADVSSFKSKAALKFDQMIRQSVNDHQDTYSDPTWGPLTDAKFSDMKKQYDANINNVVGLMKIWCLEHNRDYSGFKAPEVNYVF